MPCHQRLATIDKNILDLKISEQDRAIVAQAAHELKQEGSMIPYPLTDSGNWITPQGCHITHLTLGTNSLAVDAAATAATALGYRVFSATSNAHPDSANTVGIRLAASLNTMVTTCETTNRPQCLLEGGEATVDVPVDHGQGGRNQHTVVAAAHDILVNQQREWPTRALLASFGTDGEDGPTSSAGGFVDDDIAKSLSRHPDKISEAITRCDSHELLKPVGGLIETGLTGTNVADVRIVLINPKSN
jgi:glycerate-2-kinase